MQRYPDRAAMSRTGIGLAGIDGLWWLPAAEPFRLPVQLGDELVACGRAIFVLFDVLGALYGTAEGDGGGLNGLLEHKVPAAIPRLISGQPVLSVRPDFQLCPIGGPAGYRLVATELEICPSAQGYAHAMQIGYGLRPDLVEAVARLLAGRELLIVGSRQWSEFLFEQLAFCKALAEVGARGRVLYDQPFASLAAQARSGAIWQPPIFGIRERPARWDVDLLERIAAHSLTPYCWPNELGWPARLDSTVVFRFGYFDCFAPEAIQRMAAWEASGAAFLNPTCFIFDSKVALAALGLPAVRQAIDERDSTALALLDRYIPETILLESTALERLEAEREEWVVKYAGYDQGNQAWGGRSVQLGAQCDDAEWAAHLRRCLALPWPVVAQRNAPTALLDGAYIDERGEPGLLRGGATRLRSFLLRDGLGAAATACGTHITIAASRQVSESTEAVQGPVVFGDSACHPERSEGSSTRSGWKIPRCARDDNQ